MPSVEKLRRNSNEAKFALERNRLREDSRVPQSPMPLAPNCPLTLRVSDAIKNLDRADDNASWQLVRIKPELPGFVAFNRE